MQSGRILIVDDSEDNRRLLSYLLGKEGYASSEVPDGASALNFCRTSAPDIVLLDISMPGMDGFEVCEALMKETPTADISVIFLTAKTDKRDRLKGLALGAVDYITKPFDRTEVILRVRNQMRIRNLANSLKSANETLLERQRTLEADLAAAAQIQQSLIPKKPPVVGGYRFAWRFVPSRFVGGDIFNIHFLDANHLSIYLVDVSGHGVPSAMVTVSVSQTLLPLSGVSYRNGGEAAGDRITAPKALLEALDRDYPLDRFDKHFTISYGVLNIKTGRFRYAGAGHPYPVLLRNTGEIELLTAGGTIIGLGGVLPFEEGEVHLSPGDRLFFYSDGIVEHMDATGQPFSENRLYETLNAFRDESVDSICKRVMNAFEEYGGSIAEDDITLLAVERSADR